MNMRIDPIMLYETQPAIKPSDLGQTQTINQEAVLNYVRKYHVPSLLMTKSEYRSMLEKRPLIKYRPLKNSFVKKGDKIILANTLGVNEDKVDICVDTILKHLLLQTENKNNSINNLIDNQEKNIAINAFNDSNEYVKILVEAGIDPIKVEPEIIGPYILRHGSKDQVIDWLKYKLSDVKTSLQEMYKILDDNNCSLYNYYCRPCHLLDNHSIKKINETITTSLNNSQKAGYITPEQNTSAIEWALKRIYELQNNSVIQKAADYIYKNS